MLRRSVASLIVMALGICLAVPAWAGLKGDVVVFHAGSLTVPLAEMEKQFEALYPDVDIKREAGGSTKMARLISEVGKPADIMASADYKVIDNNLVPGFADINIRFATNQLVLCYTDQSRFADEINADNWHEILQREGVVWGHSDPNLDPCGYRSLMVLQLAEKFYDQPGLYDRLVEARKPEWIRPKSVELVSMLKTGNMDYAWEYLSVAVQHELKYLTLDPHINLGDYRYDDFYAQAAVEVTGKKPGTMITKKGKSVTYGVTLLREAMNREAAVAFLEFMLSPDHGLKILKDMGQPPFIPCRIPSEDMLPKVPEQLRSLVEVAK
ncbi:tungstate/molybdate binding protein [Paucidesulfovibrio gracilis DSM 16080]|uniref:Tungstate/molybdate binding protein n=1 Tax=Paucidesulfovibrio gracilis DSM 16080 TaxID=1121449 RepID=A0A1T4Y186_9BACT|nr:tungstate ABC transporter substrate-binding protein WtpA [Paucidesulfovibrio gracilis]SKA95536.1 tungstate/molybdate binding protein [Paucidesulfovibrio gracilis DSM 16080]